MRNIKENRNIITGKVLRNCLTVILFLYSNNSFSQDEFNVLKNSWLRYTDAQNFLYHHLEDEAISLLEKRNEKVNSITTLSDWQAWQEKIRKTLVRITGPFPEKTPLNAKITRIIQKPDFRIEHIVFESQPGFFVTSSLYIPSGIKRNQKLPAVIYCSGHSAEGYRSPVYQHVIQNLTKKGFIVFAFDPVGQGERLEYYDSVSGKSVVGGPTHEHSFPGSQALLTGISQATFMIWDGIRAVDYLLTRKEVDPLRIGITGRSGGGTQAAYIAAMDHRIVATAPENYITNYFRLLQSIGPQDAEQNIPGFIASGLDHPDFLLVRAPKPALMITTTRDMFSIQGAMETENQVARIYEAYNMHEFFRRIEDDRTHASTLKNREAMYSFFRKHLNNPGDTNDVKTVQLTPDELKVTSKGQVSLEYSGETVFSLNRKRAEELEKKLDQIRTGAEDYFKDVVTAARRLSGFREPEKFVEPVFTGRFVKKGYSVEKYFIKGEGDYVIPFLLFIPEKPVNRCLIYLHPRGKEPEADAGGEIEKIISRGITVLAPDLPGIGETGPGILKGDAYFSGVSHNLLYAASLTSRSITGIYAGDIIRLVKFIENKYRNAEITGFARGYLSPALIHAAAFSPSIKNVVIIEPYISYYSIATERMYNPLFILTAVPGALLEYDLPDLAGSLAPRGLIIFNPVDGKETREGVEIIRKGLSVIELAYKAKRAEDKLKIIKNEDNNYVIEDAFMRLLVDF
ncbi:MAG: alpha/beta hydrolase family protein [Bacteroidales bacterium]